MTRRLNLSWPKATAGADGMARPVRLLAVSDEPDRALEFESNRAALGNLDAIVGCGDLDPGYLSFLGDAFRVPLVYVRGNHDRGANWDAKLSTLPSPLSGTHEEIAGLSFIGLPWPGDQRHAIATRDEIAAWRQAVRVVARAPTSRPIVILSHAPPRGLGDTPDDHYHRGFAAYHWVCRRLQPMLWLHGHTALAASPEWRHTWGGTTLVNVTGAVLVVVSGAPAAETTGATIGARGAAEIR